MEKKVIKFDRAQLRDKIHACWMGKNIGGTMGAPYEGTHELLDIKGYASQAGKIIPNDDLDLQLVWLRAMDEMGPTAVNEQVLGEYWLTYVGPAWNEYGRCKSNMREGLLPPMSGQVYNDEWKHSNGAWIRTELWACLYPGRTEDAIQYAYYDACVDHGFEEGTYAAIFVAAMESAAFLFSDARTLLDIGLSKIPADCRIAKAVRLVMDEYEKGTDWKVVRNMLVEQSSDIGWFQAPANVAYVVLGLLYGGCDFKKSMIYTINCGDDTDCTAGTLGALLGIMHGTAGLPKDWCEHIGDEIVTWCNLNGHGEWPASCTQLTDIIMDMLPTTIRSVQYNQPWRDYNATDGFRVVITDGDVSDQDKAEPEAFMGDGFVQRTFCRSRNSIHQAGVYAEVWVELDDLPEIVPGGTLTGKITLRTLRMLQCKHYRLRWLLPDGWRVEGKTNVAAYSGANRISSVDFTIVAGEQVAPNNRLVLEVSCVDRPTCIYVPVVILG